VVTNLKSCEKNQELRDRLLITWLITGMITGWSKLKYPANTGFYHGIPFTFRFTPRPEGGSGREAKKKVVHGDATLVTKLMTKKITIKTFRTWDVPTWRVGSASLLGI
jgi:hypothetical protein